MVSAVIKFISCVSVYTERTIGSIFLIITERDSASLHVCRPDRFLFANFYQPSWCPAITHFFVLTMVMWLGKPDEKKLCRFL